LRAEARWPHAKSFYWFWRSEIDVEEDEDCRYAFDFKWLINPIKTYWYHKLDLNELKRIRMQLYFIFRNLPFKASKADEFQTVSEFRSFGDDIIEKAISTGRCEANALSSLIFGIDEIPVHRLVQHLMTYRSSLNLGGRRYFRRNTQPPKLRLHLALESESESSLSSTSSSSSSASSSSLSPSSPSSLSSTASVYTKTFVSSHVPTALRQNYPIGSIGAWLMFWLQRHDHHLTENTIAFITKDIEALHEEFEASLAALLLNCDMLDMKSIEEIISDAEEHEEGPLQPLLLCALRSRLSAATSGVDLTRTDSAPTWSMQHQLHCELLGDWLDENCKRLRIHPESALRRHLQSHVEMFIDLLAREEITFATSASPHLQSICPNVSEAKKTKILKTFIQNCI
jgi:hypothetical protein